MALGGTVTLTIEVAGVPSPTYEWSKDGSQVAITTEPKLTIEKARKRDAGDYAVIVSNDSGTAMSLTGHLTVE